MKSVVYVFGVPGDNLVKIGCSRQPGRREGALRRSARMPSARMLFEQPHPVADLMWLERAAHRRLAEDRIYPREEWFLVKAHVAIEAIKDAHAVRLFEYPRLAAMASEHAA